MANYIVTNSKFKPFSYEEVLQPVLRATEAHQNLEEQYADLSTKANVWENLADAQSDPVTYYRYKRYANDLKSAVNRLAEEGLTPTSRQDLLNMKSRYSSEITPIEAAFSRKRELEDEQRKALERDNTLMYERMASNMSLDDFLLNPSATYGKSYSGESLRKEASNIASALSKAPRGRSIRSILGDQYYEIADKLGYDIDEIQSALHNSRTAPQALSDIYDIVYSSSGMDDWADNYTKNRARGYISEGIYNAMGDTKYDRLANRGYGLNSPSGGGGETLEVPNSQYREFNYQVRDEEGLDLRNKANEYINDFIYETPKVFTTPEGDSISFNNEFQMHEFFDDIQYKINQYEHIIKQMLGDEISTEYGRVQYKDGTNIGRIKRSGAEYILVGDEVHRRDENGNYTYDVNQTKILNNTFKNLQRERQNRKYYSDQTVGKLGRLTGLSDRNLRIEEGMGLIPSRKLYSIKKSYNIPDSVPVQSYVDYIQMMKEKGLPTNSTPFIENKTGVYVTVPGSEGDSYRNNLTAELEAHYGFNNPGDKKIKRQRASTFAGNIIELDNNYREIGSVKRLSDVFDFDSDGHITNISNYILTPESVSRKNIVIGVTKNGKNKLIEVPLESFGSTFNNIILPDETGAAPYETIKILLEGEMNDAALNLVHELNNEAAPMINYNFFQKQGGTKAM